MPFEAIESPRFADEIVQNAAYIYKINRLTYWDTFQKSDQEISDALPKMFPGLTADEATLEVSFWLISRDQLFKAVCAEYDRNRGGHAQKIPLIWFTEAEIVKSGITIRPQREGLCLLASPQHIQAFLTFTGAHNLLQELRSAQRVAQHVPAPLVTRLLQEQARISCRWVALSDCECEAA